jgi:hypothetical protein
VIEKWFAYSSPSIIAIAFARGESFVQSIRSRIAGVAERSVLTRALPAWLAWAGLVIGALQLVATPFAAIDPGFTVPSLREKANEQRQREPLQRGTSDATYAPQT